MQLAHVIHDDIKKNINKEGCGQYHWLDRGAVAVLIRYQGINVHHINSYVPVQRMPPPEPLVNADSGVASLLAGGLSAAHRKIPSVVVTAPGLKVTEEVTPGGCGREKLPAKPHRVLPATATKYGQVYSLSIPA